MMRSALEWLMSRSCQSATFSSAAIAFPLTTRASPLKRSAGDRIAFVRHGRAAFLARTEEFLRFQYFGALQMPELRRPAIDARGDERKGGGEFRVTIALDDLGG